MREIMRGTAEDFNSWQQKRLLQEKQPFVKGDGRIRTGDQGFADPCLTAWLRRRMGVNDSVQRLLRIVSGAV